MTGRATIRHVALAARVSQTTVSLAFRPESRISEKTRARVMRVADRLGYTPNLVARGLRHGRSETMAFIVNDIANPFYAVMLRDAEQAALERGWCTLFGSSNWDPGKERTLIAHMIEMRVPAIIICFSETRPENYAMIREAGVPCIAVDSRPDWYTGAYVTNDFEAAAEMAAGHLVDTGCRSPVLFTAEPQRRSFSAFHRIERQFAASLAQRGIAFTPDRIIPAGLDMAAGRSAMTRILESRQTVDSLFCVNDLCAAGAIEALYRNGLRPGRDVSVIGIDDMEISAFAGLSLTSLHQPYSEIARRAVNAVADAAEGKGELSLRLELPPELRVRETTGARVQTGGG